MIKFFRHIRKNLLMENKTSKYFKYAIGEIVLVVIGILIALSINNWNENRKKEIKEIQYLVSFKNDLFANITELERVIQKSEITSNKADSILKFRNNEIDEIALPELIRFIMGATGFTVYATHEGTIQDIIGSGNLDIIKNDSIRLAIGSWEGNLKLIREWERIEKKSVDDYTDLLRTLLDLYEDDPSLIMTEATKEMLFSNRLFLNHLADREFLPFTLNELYKNELLKLQKLIKVIDN